MNAFMKIFTNIVFTLVMMALVGCGAPKRQEVKELPGSEQYPILDVLPKSIEGFSYKGLRVYPDPWGYSLRYRSDFDKTVYADIYLYPVPKEAMGGDPEDIVVGATNGALEEIDYATKNGMYSEFEILGRDDFDILGKTTSQVDIYLVRNKTPLYSLLFVTESNGKLIKARMTMPHTDANRSNDAWKRFVESAFTIILNNIDKA
jgi:hypothetical protein